LDKCADPVTQDFVRSTSLDSIYFVKILLRIVASEDKSRSIARNALHTSSSVPSLVQGDITMRNLFSAASTIEAAAALVVCSSNAYPGYAPLRKNSALMDARTELIIFRFYGTIVVLFAVIVT